MATKILNTILKLRYDTYANWQTNKDFVLQAGEASVCIVPAEAGTGLNEPAVLMKIGDGTTTWENLSYVSALAANVIPSLTGSNPTLPAESIEGLEEFIQGEIQDTNTRYQLVADGSMGVKLQSSETGSAPWTDVGTAITLDPTTNINNALSQLTLAEVTAGQGQIISSISQTNGKVSAGTRALVAADIPTLTTAKLSDFATAVDGRIDTKVGNIGESADVAEFVTGSIDTAIGTLNLNAVTAGTGQVIGQIQQTDGAVTAQLKTLTADDIPAIPQSKVTDLTTTLAGKQDTLVFNTAYNAESNKAATMTDVQNAVAGLASAMHFVGVSTTDPATGTVTIDDKPDYQPAAGDVALYEATHKEYVYDGEKWVELGDESSYAIKGSIKNEDIAADAAIDQSKIANLVTDLAAKATPADITSAIQALDKASTAVATGSKITAIEEVDGIVNVTTGAIVADDIPELPQSKITGLSTTLAGKQDAVTFDGTYNATSNKAATVSTVTNAIAALDVTDAAVEKNFVTAVSETDGKISITRRALVADDIPELATSKITGLDTTISGINDAIDAVEALVGSTAVSTQITTAIEALDAATVTAGQGEILESVTQTDGVVAVTKRSLVANDIPTIPNTKVSGLGYFATGTDATNLSLADGNYLILNGGTSAGF